MCNVLSDTQNSSKFLRLGRLGLALRRTEKATTVRRATTSAHLNAAVIPVRERGDSPAWPPKTVHHSDGVDTPRPATSDGRPPTPSDPR